MLCNSVGGLFLQTEHCVGYVGRLVSSLVTKEVYCGKTDDSIEMPFVVVGRVVPDPPRYGEIWWEMG